MGRALLLVGRVAQSRSVLTHRLIPACSTTHLAGSCRWVAKQLIKALTNHKGWAPSKAVEQARMAEALTLGEKCTLPGCSVVVVGNTGAGKVGARTCVAMGPEVRTVLATAAVQMIVPVCGEAFLYSWRAHHQLSWLE